MKPHIILAKLIKLKLKAAHGQWSFGSMWSFGGKNASSAWASPVCFRQNLAAPCEKGKSTEGVCFSKNYLPIHLPPDSPSLKLTASSHLKMDDWKTFAFPCWVSAHFQVRLLLVLGTVSVWFYFLELPQVKLQLRSSIIFGVFGWWSLLLEFPPRFCLVPEISWGDFPGSVLCQNPSQLKGKFTSILFIYGLGAFGSPDLGSLVMYTQLYFILDINMGGWENAPSYSLSQRLISSISSICFSIL